MCTRSSLRTSCNRTHSHNCQFSVHCGIWAKVFCVTSACSFENEVQIQPHRLGLLSDWRPRFVCPFNLEDSNVFSQLKPKLGIAGQAVVAQDLTDAANAARFACWNTLLPCLSFPTCTAKFRLYVLLLCLYVHCTTRRWVCVAGTLCKGVHLLHRDPIGSKACKLHEPKVCASAWEPVIDANGRAGCCFVTYLPFQEGH